jgi:DDE superfamily endonuclease
MWPTDLIGPCDRKSIVPMAARMAPEGYERLHHFISGGVWDGAPIETELAKQTDKLIGDPPPNSCTTFAIQPGMLPGMTCSFTSKDITIVSGYIPPSGISLPNRQSAKPPDPVSTKSGEGHCRAHPKANSSQRPYLDEAVGNRHPNLHRAAQ